MLFCCSESAVWDTKVGSRGQPNGNTSETRDRGRDERAGCAIAMFHYQINTTAKPPFIIVQIAHSNLQKHQDCAARSRFLD